MSDHQMKNEKPVYMATVTKLFPGGAHIETKVNGMLLRGVVFEQPARPSSIIQQPQSINTVPSETQGGGCNTLLAPKVKGKGKGRPPKVPMSKPKATPQYELQQEKVPMAGNSIGWLCSDNSLLAPKLPVTKAKGLQPTEEKQERMQMTGNNIREPSSGVVTLVPNPNDSIYNFPELQTATPKTPSHELQFGFEQEFGHINQQDSNSFLIPSLAGSSATGLQSFNGFQQSFGFYEMQPSIQDLYRDIIAIQQAREEQNRQFFLQSQNFQQVPHQYYENPTQRLQVPQQIYLNPQDQQMTERNLYTPQQGPSMENPYFAPFQNPMPGDGSQNWNLHENHFTQNTNEGTQEWFEKYGWKDH